MQAGSSERGMEFAARWAEVVFAVADTPDAMRAVRTELRDRAAAAGRNPDQLAVLPAVEANHRFDPCRRLGHRAGPGSGAG